MPFVIEGSDLQGPKAYNVEQAVGENCPNASGDVKLVQYMLKNFYGPAAAQLVVDGWIGPMTISWIKRFQEDCRKVGANVLVDSRVDRAFGQVSSVSKTVYTILLLNRALYQKNPAAYNSLPQHIALSTKPRANPYNAAPKQITVVIVVGTTPPRDVYVYYLDGSYTLTRVTGEVSFPPNVHVVYSPVYTGA